MTEGAVAPFFCRRRLLEQGCAADFFMLAAGDHSVAVTADLCMTAPASATAPGQAGRAEGRGEGMYEWILVDRLKRIDGRGVPRRVAPAGYLDVSVDRSSLAGNPFGKGHRAELCQAFGVWLFASLMQDDGSAWPEAAWQAQASIRGHAGPEDRRRLHAVAVHYEVQLHAEAHSFSSHALCAWLWHHVRLLVQGERLRLLCWCCSELRGDRWCEAPPCTCHAQSLRNALYWLYLQLTKLTISDGHTHALPHSSPLLERGNEDISRRTTETPRLLRQQYQVRHPPSPPDCAPCEGGTPSELPLPEGSSLASNPDGTGGPASLVGPPPPRDQAARAGPCWNRTATRSAVTASYDMSPNILASCSCGLLTETYFCTPLQITPTPQVCCGDWPLSDILSKWPATIATELATFTWPLTAASELARLFRCPHAAPIDFVLCEFTAAVRSANEVHHRVPTLSIDLRPSLIPGMHACMDPRDVMPLVGYPIRRCYAFPPCTHQTLSDTTARQAKMLDGRTFWGIMFVIWCWCLDAVLMMVEQPDTVIPDFFILPTQRLRTSQLGDADDKGINLYERGRERVPLAHEVGGTSGHRRLADFPDAEARDRWRSSWQRFPRTVAAIVACEPNPCDADTPPSFEEWRERFAVAWHQAGHPVPADYEAEGGRPSALEARAYQFVRGRGDGRAVCSTTPRSLRIAPSEAFDPATVTAHFAPLAALTVNSFALVFVAMQLVPLVLAPLNGLEVIGAELHLPTHRKLALAIASRWADSAINAVASTFLVGEYSQGTRVFAAPLDLVPHGRHIARNPSDRRRLARAGVRAAWCTIAALAGTAVHDLFARATTACTTLRSPVAHLADASTAGHEPLGSFSIGVYAMRPLLDRAQGLPTEALLPREALRRTNQHAMALRARLLLQGDDESIHWAEAIKPEELQDVPPDFFSRLPTFDDARLDQLPFTPPWDPPPLPKLLPKPSQPPLHGPYCPRSPLDLML